MYSTGIPPHIAILSEMSSLQSAMNSQPQVILDGVSQILEDKGPTAGNITRECVRETLSEIIRSNLSAQLPGSSANPSVEKKQKDEESKFMIYCWGGRFRMLPEAFEFRNVTSYMPGLCGGLVILKDDSLPFVVFDQRTFFQRNKEKSYLSGSAFSRLWNKKIQTSPFGVENALSLMKT